MSYQFGSTNFGNTAVLEDLNGENRHALRKTKREDAALNRANVPNASKRAALGTITNQTRVQPFRAAKGQVRFSKISRLSCSHGSRLVSLQIGPPSFAPRPPPPGPLDCQIWFKFVARPIAKLAKVINCRCVSMPHGKCYSVRENPNSGTFPNSVTFPNSGIQAGARVMAYVAVTL
jgi:hypothetical protein